MWNAKLRVASFRKECVALQNKRARRCRRGPRIIINYLGYWPRGQGLQMQGEVAPRNTLFSGTPLRKKTCRRIIHPQRARRGFTRGRREGCRDERSTREGAGAYFSYVTAPSQSCSDVYAPLSAPTNVFRFCEARRAPHPPRSRSKTPRSDSPSLGAREW